MNKFLFLLLFSLCSSALLSNQAAFSPKSVDQTTIDGKLGFVFGLNKALLLQHFHIGSNVALPTATNNLKQFRLEANYTMSAELQAKYPDIKTFRATSIDGATWGNISISQHGFHGIFFNPRGTYYIDPIAANNQDIIVFKKTDYPNQVQTISERFCAIDESSSNKNLVPFIPSVAGKMQGYELRTYRLALACTGEYANFHGGNIPDVLAAFVVTMNRVNGVYEREFSATMTLIGNTDTLIYLNGGSDPYSNNNGGIMLGQNQTTIDNLIGSANYDIGHVFSTGGGGIAGYSVVCDDGDKARGVTGLSAPIGDAFDVDYVCHEMGHQFGGSHTFNNSCNGNRNAGTAFEPGSGSTIMAYAGICAPNLQNNSDDYFHSGSLDEMGLGFQFFSPSTCPVVTPTGNNDPDANPGSGNWKIPISTPFRLDGSATDPDGDSLTFCWEQIDLGLAGHPNSPIGNAPLFRSWTPTTDSFRIFPRMVNIIAGNTVMGETLPNYGRNMEFNLVVRDGKGGTNYDDITMEVVGTAGPFNVTSPVQNESVYVNQPYTVQWTVNNTDQAPINCQFVNIRLSEDGGYTYPHVLATNVPNNGMHTVMMPNIIQNLARIIVESVGNVFFNISKRFIMEEGTIPLAPIDLVASPDFVSNVQLDWTDNSSNEDYFMIERSIADSNNFVLIDSVMENIISWVDTPVSFDEPNFYRVYAKNIIGQSSNSNIASYLISNIGDAEQLNISLYPNPTSSDINILGSNDKIKWLSIYSLDGKLVRKLSFKSRILLNIQPSVYQVVLADEHDLVLYNTKLIVH